MNKTKNTVEFVRCERYRSDDNYDYQIWHNGNVVNTIRVEVADFGFTTYDYKVACYVIEFGDNQSIGFPVHRNSQGKAITPARTVLAQAKKWVRENIEKVSYIHG